MSGPTPSPGTNSGTHSSWEARPWAARGIRALVLIGPVVAAWLAIIFVNNILPAPGSIWAAIGRVLAILSVSTGVVVVVDRMARHLLPLAVLMQLSLVFPDQAPSRFKTALKAGSSRHLDRAVSEARVNGLSEDPGIAACEVVEIIGVLGDHDRRTRGHSERVRLYAELIGRELHLSKEERQKLQWGALLHDLGKLMVPPEILNKPGKPDPEEWAIIQQHPAWGMTFIEPLRPFLGEWVDAIGGHHEKWDGTGYPQQLRGAQITRAAAIVAVADSVEVMTAVRSYKKAMSIADARAEVTRCAGMHFSPEVVRAFLSVSLGRMRLVMGPLAFLAQVPLLSNLVQLPAAVSALPAAASGAMAPVASGLIAAGLGLSGPAGSAASIAAPISIGVASPSPSTVATGARLNAEQRLHAERPVVPIAPASEGHGSGQEVGQSGGPLDTPTTVPPATTTTAPATTTTAPAQTTTTSAPTPVTTSILGTPLPAVSLALKVSSNGLRLSATDLDGSSFPAGSKIFVFASTNGTRVDFTYPGGTREDTVAPYDMIGNVLLAAKAYVLPSAAGTYTVTATATGIGSSTTVTATFTVT